MATPNNVMFPDNVAGMIGNLAAPGTGTNNIFEYRESVIRALAAYGCITAYRQTAEPSTPAAWDFWIVPGTLSGASINSADIKIYDGSVWQNITPALFAKAVMNKAGGGTWKEAINGLVQTPANKSYTITLKMPFAAKIIGVGVQTSSGACTVDLNVDGVSVQQVAAGTAYNSAAPSVSVAANSKLSLTVSDNATALDLAFEVQMVRT